MVRPGTRFARLPHPGNHQDRRAENRLADDAQDGSTDGPKITHWKYLSLSEVLVTDTVTNIEIWAVSIIMQLASDRAEVNAAAGMAPVDTSWLFLPTLMSVIKKSTAMFEGTTSRSGRKMTWG